MATNEHPESGSYAGCIRLGAGIYTDCPANITGADTGITNRCNVHEG